MAKFQFQKLLQQAKAQLEQWLQAGFILQEQDDYVISITQDETGAKINDKMVNQ